MRYDIYGEGPLITIAISSVEGMIFIHVEYLRIPLKNFHPWKGTIEVEIVIIYSCDAFLVSIQRGHKLEIRNIYMSAETQTYLKHCNTSTITGYII